MGERIHLKVLNDFIQLRLLLTYGYVVIIKYHINSKYQLISPIGTTHEKMCSDLQDHSKSTKYAWNQWHMDIREIKGKEFEIIDCFRVEDLTEDLNRSYSINEIVQISDPNSRCFQKFGYIRRIFENNKQFTVVFTDEDQDIDFNINQIRPSVKSLIPKELKDRDDLLTHKRISNH